MKKLLLFSFIFFIVGKSIAQSPVTFTLVTAPCDTNGVLVAHYSAASLPCEVDWMGGHTYTSGFYYHTVSTLTDTLFHYDGGGTFVRVSAIAGGGIYDTGSFLGAPPFTFTFSGTPAGSSSPGTATVTVTGGTPPYSYNWFDAPCSTSFLGTTNPISVPAGIYGVEVKDAAGCWFSSCIDAHKYDTIRSTAFIANHPSLNNSISIYPNPADNEITIAAETSFQPNSFAQFYDLTGKLVNTVLLNGKSTVALISALTPGIYECRIVTTDNGVLVKKLVITR